MQFSIQGLCLISMLAPLVAASINGLLGRRFSRFRVYSIAILCMLVSAIAASVLFVYFFFDQSNVVRLAVDQYLYTWADVGSAKIGVGLLIDH